MKKLLIACISLVLAGCGVMPTPRIIVVTATVPPTALPTAVPTAAPLSTAPPRPTSLPPTETPVPLLLEDFEMELIVIEKVCFGSAGCNITVQPELFYGGPPLAPGDTYTLIYEVYGSEDGTLTFNLKITGEQYTVEDERISTAHQSDELTAAVVRILDR